MFAFGHTPLERRYAAAESIAAKLRGPRLSAADVKQFLAERAPDAPPVVRDATEGARVPTVAWPPGLARRSLETLRFEVWAAAQGTLPSLRDARVSPPALGVLPELARLRKKQERIEAMLADPSSSVAARKKAFAESGAVTEALKRAQEKELDRVHEANRDRVQAQLVLVDALLALGRGVERDGVKNPLATASTDPRFDAYRGLLRNLKQARGDAAAEALHAEVDAEIVRGVKLARP